MVRCGKKENPSDLGDMVLEKEAMTRCMNRLAIVPATTLRGAIVAVLAQVSGADTQMASTVDGCCVGQDKRIMGATATLMISAVAGGATTATILRWRAAVSRCDVWVRQTRSSVEVQARLRNYDEIGVRQDDWRALSVHNGVLHGVIDKRFARRARKTLRAATNVGWLQ